MDVLKDTPVGDTVRDVAVTVTEAGVRGYEIVETEVEKVVASATEIVNEARVRAAAATAPTAGPRPPDRPAPSPPAD